MAPVKLYVYDLSRGMAAQLSRQLVGRYIEGIWHTSIVFHGKEWYYGSGIQVAHPGTSHHGKPLKIVDLGESEIDEAMFREYINEMRSVYTADKYHLLEFNCNSFTNDVAGFLTGGSIPAYIKDLPSDFLNTPFGAALRPTIDQMFRGHASSSPAPPAGPASSPLLQDVVNRTTHTSAPTPSVSTGTKTLSAPIQICTNPSSFGNILERHKAAVAFFTSQTCPPCKMVEPVFDELAHSKASPQVAFVKIDMGVGMGGMVGEAFGVRATPTFLFFLNGKKAHEVRGANVPELRSQVNLLLYDAFPQHPHARLQLSALRSVSLKPILFTQVPKLDALQSKLSSTIDSLNLESRSHDRDIIATQMIPFLQSKLGANTATRPQEGSFNWRISEWIVTTERLAKHIPPVALFPLIDLWRLAILVPEVASHFTTPSSSAPSLILAMLKIAADSLGLQDAKNTVLTALRLACNIFSNPSLVRLTFSAQVTRDGSPRGITTNLLVQALLADTSNVRVAAASLAFNISALLQTPLMESFYKGKAGIGELTRDEVLDDVEWEVELLSAVVEGITRENNEDALHRLVTCLGLLVHLSPHLEEVRPLLEVLQAKETLHQKLSEDAMIQKDSIRNLVKEVADELC